MVGVLTQEQPARYEDPFQDPPGSTPCMEQPPQIVLDWLEGKDLPEQDDEDHEPRCWDDYYPSDEELLNL